MAIQFVQSGASWRAPLGYAYYGCRRSIGAYHPGLKNVVNNIVRVPPEGRALSASSQNSEKMMMLRPLWNSLELIMGLVSML